MNALHDLEVVAGIVAILLAVARYIARKRDEDLYRHRGTLTALVTLSAAAWLVGAVGVHIIRDHRQQARNAATRNCEQQALRQSPVQPVQLDRSGGIKRRNDNGTFYLGEIVFSPSQRYEAAFSCQTDSSGTVQGLVTFGSNFGGGSQP